METGFFSQSDIEKLNEIPNKIMDLVEGKTVNEIKQLFEQIIDFIESNSKFERPGIS